MEELPSRDHRLGSTRGISFSLGTRPLRAMGAIAPGREGGRNHPLAIVRRAVPVLRGRLGAYPSGGCQHQDL
jgi:hypothetical protein